MKVHPAWWISRASPYRSKSLTSFQPGTQASLSNRRALGKCAPSLIRMAPVLMLSAIGIPSVCDDLPSPSSWTLLVGSHHPRPRSTRDIAIPGSRKCAWWQVVGCQSGAGAPTPVDDVDYLPRAAETLILICFGLDSSRLAMCR